MECAKSFSSAMPRKGEDLSRLVSMIASVNKGGTHVPGEVRNFPYVNRMKFFSSLIFVFFIFKGIHANSQNVPPFR